ncbi:tripartite tricarboxylate transporter substrate binding protein [soil metagenome]
MQREDIVGRFGSRLRAAFGVVPVFALALVGAMPSAQAQSFPDKPISLVVPYAAGGGTDAVARVVGKAMGDALGQQVIIENRPGGSGMIGANFASKAAPNGYTLVMITSSLVIQGLRPSGVQNATIESFQPIGVMATAPMALNVHPSTPHSSVKEFIDYARANPGKLNYATFGKGTTPHLVTEQMNSELGLKMVDVPYQGAAPAMTDLARGELQVFCDILATSLPLAKDGRTRMLALMADKRSVNAPDVPTFAELGYPNVKATVLMGISAPAGTPAPIVDKLAAALSTALRSPEVIDRIRAQSLEPGTSADPAGFAAQMVQERDKWKALVEKLQLKLE